MPGHVVQRVVDVLAEGVAVNQNAFAAFASEQVVHRRIERLALDVPEGNVYRGDRGHGNGPAPPIRPAIEVLPEVLGVEGIATHDAGNHVITEIARDREFAAVERSIAQAIDALIRLNLEGDEVSPRRSNVHVCIGDLQGRLCSLFPIPCSFTGSLRWPEILRPRPQSRRSHRPQPPKRGRWPRPAVPRPCRSGPWARACAVLLPAECRG